MVEEITAIYDLFQHEAILIIDDVRLFGQSKETGHNEDWSQINKDHLLQLLGSRVTNVYDLDSQCAKNDRMIIHICAK